MKHFISLPARLALIGLLTIFSLIAAACSPSTATNTPSSSIPVTGAATVQIANNADLGTILATADGRTLYTNTVDTPESLKCANIACTAYWEPYTVNAQPAAGKGLPGSLGTVTRPDGSTQVTYNNQPLYTFYQDKPGDAKGNGFTDLGGTWHVVALESPSGASSPAASSPGAGNGDGGYGSYP